MSQIIFNHPRLSNPKLVIDVGPNDITWGYGLNTQTTPTYGGEVVQILSAYIDDLNINGEVPSYAKMEEIYKWFIEYMQIASQGRDGNRYIEQPIVMQYPERGWELKIQVKELPGMRYGVDVVAPQWNLVAQIVESEPEMNALALKSAIDNNFQFNRLSAGIGYKDENPFSDPQFFHKLGQENRSGGDVTEYDAKAGSNIILDYIDKFAQIMVDGDALVDFLFGGEYGPEGASRPSQGQNNNPDRRNGN